ncbi:response regulator [Geobacter sp. SVR]|uniref:response regulator n=1 Tax=Geobacter sp. SVR TaxID=2495594 RepID=UPI00143EFDBC|nr:response regulator [Geobacter sp. SVR]BCS52689.1 histidine kinase [Geobacter sp. SVR]GCF86816.1 histidine kinase [Geobacter sp. SVR]
MASPTTALIIDDEELERLPLRLYIEESGCSVLEAADGRTGIDIIQKEQPDLVFTDLRMPGMSGLEVIEYIAREYPETPVIAVSGSSDVQHAVEALRSGAWDYIVKPVQDLSTFDVVIQRVLERKWLISENKRYQDSLEEMVRERTKELLMLSQVAAQSPVSIVITDASGSIEYVNPQFTHTTGYTADEILHQNPRIWKSDQTSTQVHRQLWETISAGNVWEGDFYNRKKNGDILLEHAIISAIRDSNGTISHFLAIKEDITEKVKLEEEAKRTQVKLIQADKLSSLGLLVSGIAHEINNPNNFIMRNTELLDEAWHDAMPILDEYYREHGDFNLGDFQFSEASGILPRLFSGLKDGSLRIRNIVERLKNFARQDSGSVKDCFDLNKIILDAISILNHEINKKCENFHLAAAHALPMAMGNAQQIEQVMINLIMNSLQSLPDKTRGIRIETALTEDNKHIVVTVTDEGCGMPSEVLEKLTEPFFTTKGDSGGTGLGLYISTSLLRENNGTLLFASKSEAGTTATVTLKVFQQL